MSVMDVPAAMRAIDPTEAGGPEVLVVVERPTPRPGPGEVLIRVAAAGVNRPDVLQRTGGYAPPPGAPSIPGLEVAGHVVAVGAANGRNPLSIVTPCHRVVGASGALTGFAGGLAAKDLLLSLERRPG